MIIGLGQFIGKYFPGDKENIYPLEAKKSPHQQRGLKYELSKTDY
jgi:hypothetical protein